MIFTMRASAGAQVSCDAAKNTDAERTELTDAELTARKRRRRGVRVEREVRPHEWKITSTKGARHITPMRHKAMPVSLARPAVA
jgi:hypothetical protein